MRILLPFLLMLMVAGACSHTGTAPLPPNKMQEVLLDIHIAESWSVLLSRDSTQPNTMQRHEDSLVAFYQQIFRHHQVTGKEFMESLDWYRQHPQELDSIYMRMIPEATLLESSVPQ